jgi:hypothetical protein
MARSTQSTVSEETGSFPDKLSRIELSSQKGHALLKHRLRESGRMWIPGLC